MSIQIKLHIDDTVINILDYNQTVAQNSDYTGRPSAKPEAQSISFSYETIKNDPFFGKLLSEKMSDYLKFVISPMAMNGKSTKIEFLDFYVLECNESFDGVSNKPMITNVKVSFASMILNDVVMDVKYWKVTDPYAKDVPVSTPNYNEEDEEQDVIEYYLTDANNNRIEENLKQEIGNTIYLNVHTKNLIGEVLTLNLDSEEVDYKHNGTILKNDTLTDYQINKNIERIELEVINQED